MANNTDLKCISKEDAKNYKYLVVSIDTILGYLSISTRSTYSFSDEQSYYFFRAISDSLAEVTLALVKLKKRITKEYNISGEFDVDIDGHLINPCGDSCVCCRK